MTLSMNDQAAAYIRLLRTWWWLPVLFGLVSSLAVYGATRAFITPMYGASVTLEVSTPGSTPQTSASDANSAATLLTTSPVLAQTSRHLGRWGRRDPTALQRAACLADTTDRFVTCTTTSRLPRAASGVLNHLARVFIAMNRSIQAAQFQPSLDSLALQETQLRHDMATLQTEAAGLNADTSQDVTAQYRLTALQSQISQDQDSLSQLTVQQSTLQTQMLQAEGSVRIVDPASPASNPISPHPVRNALLGLIVGLGVAAALVVLLETLDDRFRSVDEVAQLTGLPVLAAVRRFRGPVSELSRISYTRPRSVFAEAFRVARTNLQFAAADDPPHVILVTSARDGEGKTTCASNLAIALAATGRRVLLVDADLHRAGLTLAWIRLAGLEDVRSSPGLTEALRDPSLGVPGQSTPESGWPAEIPNLRVVPAGSLPSNPAELLVGPGMRRWLDLAAASCDIVILDSPPILSVADARELAALADAVVLVVATEQTSRHLVQQAKLALEATGAGLLGVIANNVTARSDGRYSTTVSYYGVVEGEAEPAQFGADRAGASSEDRPAGFGLQQDWAEEGRHGVPSGARPLRGRTLPDHLFRRRL